LPFGVCRALFVVRSVVYVQYTPSLSFLTKPGIHPNGFAKYQWLCGGGDAKRKTATIFCVYASPRDWLFCFHPHDPASKTDRILPFPLSDTAPEPQNRYLSQIFGNGVVSTPIFDTCHNALIINVVIPDSFGHYATRGNGEVE